MWRASLNDELLKDYKSFLIQNGLRVWHKDSPEALTMRERLKHDVAPELPPVRAGMVPLTGLSALQQTHAPTHRPAGYQRGAAVLGLYRLSRLQGHPPVV